MGPFSLNLGKDIYLKLNIKFKSPHPTLDAEMIQRDTVVNLRNNAIDDYDEEDGDADLSINGGPSLNQSSDSPAKKE